MLLKLAVHHNFKRNTMSSILILLVIFSYNCTRRNVCLLSNVAKGIKNFRNQDLVPQKEIAQHVEWTRMYT